MAENGCVKVGCPYAIRLSKQDSCTGAAVPGAANGAYIKCGRNTTLEKVLRDEEVSEFVADCGASERYVQPPSMQGWNLNFEVTNFSPETETLLTGATPLTDGVVNAGVMYPADQGCSTSTVLPRFLAEVFFQTRGGCASGSEINFIRFVIPSISFSPTELDAEGQIRVVRFLGTSDAAPVSGVIDGNDGPFGDLPAGIVTSLSAQGDTPMHGFWIQDPIADPGAGLTLATDTCYTVTVPPAVS